MQNTERDLRTLLGNYLSARSSNAKELARRIGCDPRTAEGFRAGRYWPQAKHWIGIVAEFGADCTDSVFHPAETALRLEKEIRDLEQQLAARKAAHRQAAVEAKAASPRAAKAVAAALDRTTSNVEREPAP